MQYTPFVKSVPSARWSFAYGTDWSDSNLLLSGTPSPLGWVLMETSLRYPVVAPDHEDSLVMVL